MTGPVEPQPAGRPPAGSRNWALAAHLSALVGLVTALPFFLGFLGPLTVWLLRRDADPFVAAHAREALNFNVSLLVYALVALVVAVLTLGLALIVLAPIALVIGVAWVVLVIVAAIRAANGDAYRYPLTIRFVR